MVINMDLAGSLNGETEQSLTVQPRRPISGVEPGEHMDWFRKQRSQLISCLWGQDWHAYVTDAYIVLITHTYGVYTWSYMHTVYVDYFRYAFLRIILCHHQVRRLRKSHDFKGDEQGVRQFDVWNAGLVPSKVVDGIKVCKSNTRLLTCHSHPGSLSCLLFRERSLYSVRSQYLYLQEIDFGIFWLCRWEEERSQPRHASRYQSGLYKPVATGQGVSQMSGLFGDLGYCTQSSVSIAGLAEDGSQG